MEKFDVSLKRIFENKAECCKIFQEKSIGIWDRFHLFGNAIEKLNLKSYIEIINLRKKMRVDDRK